jgi:cellulose synthase/poly-beta-1,6-N-acetylglucosamine synthase-like glycosyltransferase
VAEDADLGIRLHKDGYRTAIVESATYEEANSHLGNWIRQRSRWVKGYMQTWLVHMRHPLALWRAMGTSGFVGFQVLIGGTPMTLLLNPLYAVLTTLWYLTHLDMLHVPFPGWVYWMAAINLLLGNFAFTYANMAAVARRNVWALMGWAALSPVYWALMSIAAWKALVQLVLRPSYWEKTEHGLTSTPTKPTFDDQSVAS